MKILSALLFPLRRPLRLAALALAQSLFLWLLITAVDVSGRWPNDLESIAILALFFGAPLCNAFWLFGSSVASLQRVIAGKNSLAALRTAHFKPRGIGPAIASVVLIAYLVLFLALAAVPARALEIVSQLGMLTSDEALRLIASHALVLGLGTLVTLLFFVSLASYAAVSAGLYVDAGAADQFHPRKNLAASLRYLIRQFVLLGMAAVGFNIGLELIYANMPSGTGALFEDPFLTTWWVIAIFAGSAVVHYFWHASLHLLASYVVATENTASS